MFDTIDARNYELVLSAEEDDELRRVYLDVQDNDDIVVVERSDGEVTMQAFGALRHTRCIRVSAAQLGRMLEAIGARGVGIEQAIRGFFAHDDVYLCDLQDKLDSSFVTYQYAAWSGNNMAFRAA